VTTEFLPCDCEQVLEETTEVDFKAGFDPTTRREWCELVKDLVALANSGGGTILFGVNDDGGNSGADVAPILALDPATITDKVHAHTEQQFAGFALREATRQGQRIAALHIGAARFPMVFVKPGQYEVDGRPKSAFAQGTVYFRHGAKSEPGTTDDIRLSMERELKRVKDFWLAGIATVVEAPTGSQIQVLPPEVRTGAGEDARKIRLSTDEGSQVFKVVQPDELYPHRQKELLVYLRSKGVTNFSSHDLLVVRKLHKIEDEPTYSGKSKWGTRQYSDAFAAWLIEQSSQNPKFMEPLREAFRKL
jgi:hypothetical protein